MKWVSFLFSLMFWGGITYLLTELGVQGVLTSALQAEEDLVARQVLTEFEFYMFSVFLYLIHGRCGALIWDIASKYPNEILVQVESLVRSPSLSPPLSLLSPSFLLSSIPPALFPLLSFKSSMNSHVIEICIRREHAEGIKVFDYLLNQRRIKKQT